MIHRATIADVPQAARIINDAAEFGLMLPKSLAQLYENVREFQIATDDDTGEVVGVCGLSIVWANLGEVVSLAVRADQRGKGLGRRLVQACIDEARELGVRKLMTLTYERTFFEKLGFEVVNRQALPLKVWSECVRCPKNQACDEIAMIHVLQDVPDLSPPQAPPQPAQGDYIVPVTLTRSMGKV